MTASDTGTGTARFLAANVALSLTDDALAHRLMMCATSARTDFSRDERNAFYVEAAARLVRDHLERLRPNELGPEHAALADAVDNARACEAADRIVRAARARTNLAG